MSVLYLRLYGGLGNQFFQFSAALKLAQKNMVSKIIIDDSSLDNYQVKRNNELFNFFDLSHICFDIDFSDSIFLKMRVPKFFPLKVKNFLFVSDKNFLYFICNELSDRNLRFYLDGYFQDIWSFSDFELHVEFLKKILINSNFSPSDNCVIHIRGGDFVTLGWNASSSKDYYHNAILYMKNNFGVQSFSVVTDDLDYAHDVLGSVDCNYKVIGGSLFDDFHLIGAHKYRILSSSTFAFWASALGDNCESFVIAPLEWFPGKLRNILLPNEIQF